MKIIINKKQLMNGVKFTHQVTDLNNEKLKVEFFYIENTFVLTDYSNDMKLYTFNDYLKFRKQLTFITLNW